MQDKLDKLSGLLIRKEFLENLETEVRRVVRYQRPLTVLMIEIQHDYFQPTADVRWSMGYSLLKQVGALIHETYRNVDLASRFEGEIFAAALPETGLDGAHIAGERLRSRVENHEFMGTNLGDKVRVAVNIGVAVHPEHGKSSEELLEAARMSMIRARELGGNKVVVGDGEEVRVSETSSE